MQVGATAVQGELIAVMSIEVPMVELTDPEQGVKLLGLLLTGSTGQQMAGRNGLA
jgi:hypothetical protein